MIYLQTVIISFVSLVLLFIVAKILGNKQISELNMFDYINGITIGSIAAEMATVREMNEILTSGTAIIVYGVIGLAISFLTIKSIKCRRFFSGRAIILIGNGKIYPENLKKARLDINDLLTKARIGGYFNISDVSYAILEDNGEISFLPFDNARPVVLSDVSQATEERLASVPAMPHANVIIDGKILPQNLNQCGKDEIWLLRQLKQQKINSPSEVFLATVDADGTLSAFSYSTCKNSGNMFT